MSRIDDFHDSFWIFAPLTSICVDRFLNKTNDTCVNSTENRFTKRHYYLCDIAALGPRLQDYKKIRLMNRANINRYERLLILSSLNFENRSSLYEQVVKILKKFIGAFKVSKEMCSTRLNPAYLGSGGWIKHKPDRQIKTERKILKARGCSRDIGSTDIQF